MIEHIHRWRCYRADLVTCDAAGCNTIVSISDLIANTEQEVAIKTKTKILSRQLFAKELKKAAHDRAYAWIRQNTNGVVDTQGVLL